MLAPEILGRVAGSLLGAGERANLGPLAHLLASDPSQWPAGLGAHLIDISVPMSCSENGPRSQARAAPR